MKPDSNKALLGVAAILLAIPVVALLWVGSYAKVEPVLLGFPFFIWYQFLWVFLCSGMTWGAYRLIEIARPRGRRAAPQRLDLLAVVEGLAADQQVVTWKLKGTSAPRSLARGKLLHVAPAFSRDGQLLAYPFKY